MSIGEMPGISFKYEFGSKSAKVDDEVAFLEALDSTIYNEQYKREVLLKETPYLLGCTTYPEYPVKIFENSNFLICLEGRIYGRDSNVINEELNGLMNCIFDSKLTNIDEDKKSLIVNWLLKTDGDFVICALNKKTRDFLIMNDLLGRLPLYYYKDNLKLILSRELQFISYLIWDYEEDDKFDRMAISQYLMFAAPLGKRTLLNNIYRLEPATLVRICYNKNYSIDIKIDNLHVFNFEKKKFGTDDIKKNVEELVSLFSVACKNRANFTGKNIISLSGGFDSSAVAACMSNNEIPCSAVTYRQPHWRPLVGSSSEAQIAEQLADSFNIDWENYDLIEPKAKDLLMLLRMKYGLNYLGFSYMLPFYDELKKRNNSAITFFTGDGGNNVFDSFKATRDFNNLDDLVSYIIYRYCDFSLSDVATLTKVTTSEIVDELKNILSSFPEQDLNQKCVHFLIYQSAFKQLFEWEDRNRYYFWSVTPFYSIPFFNYAMSCADSNKSQSAFHRDFLYMLSPAAASIKHPDFDYPITSKVYEFIVFMKSFINRYSILRKIIKKIRGKNAYEHNSKIISCLHEQIDNCQSVTRYFSRNKLENILNNCTNYSKIEIDLLFTIISLIEKEYCENSAIQKYYI